MVDQGLSKGVIIFLGTPEVLTDQSDEARVIEALGDRGLDLLPRIKAILGDLKAAEPPPWHESDLAEMSRRVESWLTTHHPVLSAEAIHAVARRYTFDWR